MWWKLDYEPYLLFKWNDSMHAKSPPKGKQYRVLVLGGSTAGMMPDRLLQATFEEVFEEPIQVVNLRPVAISSAGVYSRSHCTGSISIQT